MRHTTTFIVATLALAFSACGEAAPEETEEATEVKVAPASINVPDGCALAAEGMCTRDERDCVRVGATGCGSGSGTDESEARAEQ